MREPIITEFGFECVPTTLRKRMVRSNVRLFRTTKERLVRAKEKLHMSETAMIEAGLRLLFRKEGVE
jgi:hypothetical protein